MKRKQYVTNWAMDFECIGGVCGLTCCTAEWRILLTEKETEFYRNIGGELGERLKEAVDFEKKCMKCRNGKCAMLDENGLCDIIKLSGPHNLSHTCQEFPRKITDKTIFDEVFVEILCPPVAKRLINGDNLDFVEISTKEKISNVPTEMTEFVNFQDEIRNLLYELLKYRPGEYTAGKAFIAASLMKNIITLAREEKFDTDKIMPIVDYFCIPENIEATLNNCEQIGNNLILITDNVWKLLILFNDKNLMSIFSVCATVISNMRDVVNAWVNNKELFGTDISEYRAWRNKNYPLMGECYLKYSLFSDWVTDTKEDTGKRFVARMTEFALMQISAMAKWKQNGGTLTEDEFSVIVAATDRGVAHAQGIPEKMHDAFAENLGMGDFALEIALFFLL